MNDAFSMGEETKLTYMYSGILYYPTQDHLPCLLFPQKKQNSGQMLFGQTSNQQYD